jgi:hypothetical protein
MEGKCKRARLRRWRRCLQIGFEFARSLCRWPFEIERAYEFAPLVHEVDDPFASYLLCCVCAKGLGDGRSLGGIASEPNDTGIEVFKIGLQNIRRVALWIDGDEKRDDCRLA